MVSAPSRSASEVEPTRSQNSTVTGLRSPCMALRDVRIFSARWRGVYDAGSIRSAVTEAAAGSTGPRAAGVAGPRAASTACPHAGQKRAPPGSSAPQAPHIAARAAPHPMQNLAPCGLSCPQRAQDGSDRADMTGLWHPTAGAHAASGASRGEDASGTVKHVEDRESLLTALRKVEIADAPRGSVELDARRNPVQNVYIRRSRDREAAGVRRGAGAGPD